MQTNPLHPEYISPESIANSKFRRENRTYFFIGVVIVSAFFISLFDLIVELIKLKIK